MKIVTTKDGSHSLYLEDMNEHYHSIHGALQEALHVFLKMGWDQLEPKEHLSILEIGLGTGLNATLAIEKAINVAQRLTYHSIEKYPVPKDLIDQLNYNKLLPKAIYNWIHSVEWNTAVAYPNSEVEFLKIQTDIMSFNPQMKYDLIFFDAFAPNKQPEMWSADVMQKMYNFLNEGGLLTTYCCQGEVKRTLKSVGFEVQKVQGPPGKREMINAWKK